MLSADFLWRHVYHHVAFLTYLPRELIDNAHIVGKEALKRNLSKRSTCHS